MADIVFRYPEMRQVVESINDIAERYTTAANTFEQDYLDATASWEGTSKDKMDQFISGPAMEYMRDTVPQLLQGLSELLGANADQMEGADQQLADNIPSSLS